MNVCLGHYYYSSRKVLVQRAPSVATSRQAPHGNLTRKYLAARKWAQTKCNKMKINLLLSFMCSGMRLSITHAGSFERFTRRNIPPYATLSHTWGEDEVSYLGKAKDPLSKFKEGFRKIAASCRLAAAEGISYVWVDTC